MERYTDVKLVAERQPEQGALVVFLDLDGARVPFGAVKLGLVDKAERLAQEQAEREQDAKPAEQ